MGGTSGGRSWRQGLSRARAPLLAPRSSTSGGEAGGPDGTDDTDGTDAAGRLGLLVEANALIGDTLDVHAVAAGLVRAVVPAFAAVAHVDVVEAVMRPDHSSVGGGPDRSGALCRVARAGADGADEWLGYQPGSPAAEALADGRSRADRDGDAPSLHVPLVARGRVLGVVGFARPAGRPPYAEADVALAEELADRAAVALDNVRLYDEARATAVALQRSLLPSVHPRLTGVDTAQRYLPGSRETEVGGDWFDVMPLSGGRVAFVIGDVMGRGLRAAAAMGQLRTAVRMLAVLDPMPEDVLRHLDDLALGTAQVQLATCVYAVFDPVRRSLGFASAGHPPPLLRQPDGTARLLEQPSGAPLGVGGVPYESHVVPVEDGSALLLYTDGLVESRTSDIDHGLERLTVALAKGPAGLDALCDHLLEEMGRSAGHDDDVAVLVARLAGLDANRVRRWTLAGDDSEVSLARSRAGQALREWGLSPLVDTAELLVSELVTNALRHAGGPLDLEVLLLDELVTCSVADRKAPLPRRRRAAVDDEGGRGLELVDLLSSRWGARATTGGKVVWFELARPRAVG